jgi:hypothetical protein
MRNRNDYRIALLNKKVRNWRIVGGLMVLLMAYALLGRMDHAARVERMAVEKPHQGFTQKLACKEPAACRVWI